MAPALPPLALTPCLPPELLTWIIAHQVYPTILVICSSRSAFLSSLLLSITTSNATDPEMPSNAPTHPLLVPTLFQRAISRHLQIVFTPELSHLRAYLAIAPSHDLPPPPLAENSEKLGSKTPMLVLYGLVALHHGTSEWSAQGLGASVASFVEAARRGAMRAVLLEERGAWEQDEGEVEREGESESEEDAADEEAEEYEAIREGEGVMAGVEGGGGVESEAESGRQKDVEDVWRQRLPMLNGSTRRLGLGSAHESWSGRTVDVGTVLRRWFIFKRGEWDEEFESLLEN